MLVESVAKVVDEMLSNVQLFDRLCRTSFNSAPNTKSDFRNGRKIRDSSCQIWRFIESEAQ